MTREWERLMASLRAFMRDFASHSRAVELDGVVAGYRALGPIEMWERRNPPPPA